MIRLGLCCKFLDEPIKYRTTTVSYLKRLSEKGIDINIHINEIIKNNVASLKASIDYCADNSIGSFRVGSDFLPVCTHSDVRYTIDQMPDADLIKSELLACKQHANKNKIRLTFHPSQFVVLSSPNEDVIQKSIEDIEYHANLSEMIGADVINIHMGGAYNDKPSAMNRFIQNFSKLSSQAKQRLTIENDDKSYSPSEVLTVCDKLKIPFVYDVHHHRCLPDELSIEEASEKALSTWDKEPLFHVSSPLDGWGNPKPFRHHDYIQIEDFPEFWKTVGNITVEVEAKAKEAAVKALRLELLRKNWTLFP